MECRPMIYLLRHGAIDPHFEGKLVGQMDVPLGELGVRQAHWWRWQWTEITFERIVCSDLVRSRKTAEIVADASEPPVETMPELREISLGQWEGLSAKTIRSRFPDEWTRRGLDLENCRPALGESFVDLASRVLPVFHTVANSCRGTVLIVGHAGINRVILCEALGLSLRNLFRFRQDYGSLSIIEPSGGGFVVHLLNRSPDSV